MRFPPLVEGRFIKRLNRFAALVDVERKEYLAHVPNSGRMGELLVPGFRVLLAPAPSGTGRKTSYDLALVDTGSVLSSADARLPNKLVAEALAQRRMPQFRSYRWREGSKSMGIAAWISCWKGPRANATSRPSRLRWLRMAWVCFRTLPPFGE